MVLEFKMRFLILGDLHGRIPNIRIKNFDAVVTPGDFCSDSLRKEIFRTVKQKLKDPRFKKEWYDIMGRDKARKLIEKSISDGRKVLSYLNSLNVPVFIVPGNWDWTGDTDSNWDFLREDNYEKLLDGFENILDVHNSLVDIGDYQIIGYGVSSGPEYPQHKEDLARYDENELIVLKAIYKVELNHFKNIFKKASKPVILISHNVPFSTKLDKILDKKSPRYGCHYGSLIVKKLIEDCKPLISIGGHMHEHFSKTKIGNTIAINAGFGPEKNILLELENNRIKKLEFYS